MRETLWPHWTHTDRLERWVIALQVVMAGVLLGPALVHPGTALPGQAGMADLPGTVNFHWLVHTQTWTELQQSTMLMYPSQMDRLLLDGMPLDALVSWPFTSILGWPAGFTVFQWLTFSALGIATAWLARGWWGHAGAAAIAGVVAQTHPYLIRELVNGRPTQVFGAIFLPLCLGFVLRSFAQANRRDAVMAGVCWGLGTLSYWYYGAFFGISVACLLLLAAWAKALSWTQIAQMASGLLAVVALPLLYVLQADTKIPGQGSTWTDPITHGSYTMKLIQVIEHRDLGTGIITDRLLALQLLTGLLVLFAIRTYGRRRWVLPIIWFGVAIVFAMGPRISLGPIHLAGPFALFELTELSARMWWPDRALIVAVPAVALLAGGGAKAALDRWAPDGRSRWVFAVALALLMEAFVVLPGLPLPVTWGAESPQSEVLAKGTGPVLILPIGSGESQPDARMLIDQMRHGRPLINGPMPHSSSTAPAEYRKRMRSIALAPFLVCENKPTNTLMPKSAQIIRALQELDLNTVYLDKGLATRFMRDPQAYQACVESVLDIEGETDGPFVVYAL